jgi:hypothetical protein
LAAPPKKAFPLRLDPALYAAFECLLREALAKRGVKLAAPNPPRRGRPPKGEDHEDA